MYDDEGGGRGEMEEGGVADSRGWGGKRLGIHGSSWLGRREMGAAMFLAALAELERSGRLSSIISMGWGRLCGNVLRATPYSVKKKSTMSARHCPPFFHLISQSGRAGRIGEMGLIRPSLAYYFRYTPWASHAEWNDR